MRRAILFFSLGATAVGSAGHARRSPVVVPAASPLKFDVSKVSASVDSFSVSLSDMGQSMRVGSEVIELRKTDGQFALLENMSTTIGVGTKDSNFFGTRALEPIRRSVYQTFKGQFMRWSVRVENGRLTGTVQFPTGGVVDTMKVNEPASGDLLLSLDVLLALLPTAELVPGAKSTFPILDEDSGKLGKVSVAVEAKETITVPAGKFEVFRVRAQSIEGVNVYITTAEPHRVVRFNYLQSGLDLRLLK